MINTKSLNLNKPEWKKICGNHKLYILERFRVIMYRQKQPTKKKQVKRMKKGKQTDVQWIENITIIITYNNYYYWNYKQKKNSHSDWRKKGVKEQIIYYCYCAR